MKRLMGIRKFWSISLCAAKRVNNTTETRKKFAVKKAHRIIVIGLFVAVSLMAGRDSFAKLRLHTTFGEVVMENLRPGETYNTREIVNLPLTVTNYSEEKLGVTLTVMKPRPDQLREGYEPIPDTNWIELSVDRAEIQPGGHMTADVIIHVPNDEKYARKKYMVLINTTGGGKGNIGIGMYHKLLFSIAPSKTQIREDDRKGKLLANLNFTVLPAIISLYDFNLGKKQDLEKLTGKTFKIINPNDEDYRYRVNSMRIEDSKVMSARGYENCPDPSFLTFNEAEIEIPANTVKVVKLFLKIPDKREYRGKKYMFLIRTELLGQSIPVDQYNRVLVITEK